MSTYDQFTPSGENIGIVIDADHNFEDPNFIRLPLRGEPDLVLPRASYPTLSAMFPYQKTAAHAQTIDNPTPQSLDYFGSEVLSETSSNGVSISGDGTRMAVGAPYAEITGGFGDDGEVIVYRWTGSAWAFEATIINPEPGTDNIGFGRNVKLDQTGTRMVVASYRTLTFGQYSGAVYVYTRSGTVWSLERTLDPSGTSSTWLRFGEDFCFDENCETLFISEPWADRTLGTTEAGRGYLYVRSGTTWSLSQELSSQSLVTNGHYGRWCTMNKQGNVLCISNGDGNNQSFIEYWGKSGGTGSWGFYTRIYNPVTSSGDQDGTEPHTYGPMVMTDSPSGNGQDEQFLFVADHQSDYPMVDGTGDAFNATYAGIVHVWDISRCTTPYADFGGSQGARLVHVITPPNQNSDGTFPSPEMQFGKRMAVSSDGKYLLISSPEWHLDNSNLEIGEAYLFENNGFSYEFIQRISNPQPVSNEYFGVFVAADDNFTRCAFGHYKNVSGNTGAGAVQAYNINEDTTNMTLRPVDKRNKFLRVK